MPFLLKLVETNEQGAFYAFWGIEDNGSRSGSNVVPSLNSNNNINNKLGIAKFCVNIMFIRCPGFSATSATGRGEGRRGSHGRSR